MAMFHPVAIIATLIIVIIITWKSRLKCLVRRILVDYYYHYYNYNYLYQVIMQEKNGKLQQEIAALDQTVTVDVKRKIESLHGRIVRLNELQFLLMNEIVRDSAVNIFPTKFSLKDNILEWKLKISQWISEAFNFSLFYRPLKLGKCFQSTLVTEYLLSSN